MAIEQFVAPHHGVRINHSTVFSHMTPDVINGKIQNFGLSRARTWSVRSAHRARSVLRHEQEHSGIEIAGAEKSQVLLSHHLHDCHHDIMAGFTWLIKFLGDKLLYGHVPDPFPRCRIGSGHARLGVLLIIVRSAFWSWFTEMHKFQQANDRWTKTLDTTPSMHNIMLQI